MQMINVGKMSLLLNQGWMSDFIDLKMEIFMQVNLILKPNLRVMGLMWRKVQVLYIQGIGNLENNMDQEHYVSLMELDIEENGLMVKNKVKDFYQDQMENDTMECLKKGRKKDQVKWFIQMEVFTKENG